MPNYDNSPATKKDLAVLRADFATLRGDFGTLRAHVDQLGDNLTERMRDMQSEVLRAFYDWARPVDMKLPAIPRLDERVGLLEERVAKLERGEKHPH